ncbi:MAG: tyrosine--tRNA ligase [Firmicutes bacterium]|nr:tyrosine--tRNA ligase [Bacillota bacterium]
MKRFDELLFNRFFENWDKFSHEQIKSLIKVKSKTILPSVNDIDFSKQQRVKLGIDATGQDLHIGHLCPLLIMNIFIKAGHHVDLVIGDFTTKVGDPSGRVSERAILTDEQIAKNFETYLDQVGKFLDVSKLSVRKNSEWLAKISLADFLGLHQKLNLATTLQREDFRTRLEAGGLSNAEILYASLMGYDSVALNTTIELGGLDQLLNLQQCREIQRIHGQPPEVIVTTPILEGLAGDGRKMSKSYKNYVAINDSYEEKFGKFMSMPDSLIMQYFQSFGYLFENEISELENFIKSQPMEAKKQFASYFISIEAKNLKAGASERERFEQKFSKRELTADDFQVIKVKSGTTLLDALMTSNKFKSKGELKRLLTSNSIRNLDTNEIITTDFEINNNLKIKVGKLQFFQVTMSS